MCIYLERIVAKIAFCPPVDTYVFNFEPDDQKQSSLNNNNNVQNLSSVNQNIVDLKGEILLAQYCTLTKQSAIDSYRKIQKIMKYIECFYALNKYGNRIACLLIECPLVNLSSDDSYSKNTQKTIVYSHCNAEGKRL